MALPTHYTGSDGEIQIGGSPTTLVDFSIDMSVGVINSATIGKRSDMKYAGKFDVTGSITQVLVTGDLMAMLIGDTSGITTSTLESLLVATDLDAAAREVIARSGLPVYGHGTGHGLGLDVHEEPILSEKSTGKLEAGMVFTIEPGVYIPGKLGVRIEDDILVTKTGCQILSRSCPHKP